MFVHYIVNIYKFVEYDDRLYYFDATNLLTNKSKTKSQSSGYLSSSVQNIHVSLLTTVGTNTKFYTKRHIARAELVRKTQQELGWPGTEVFKIMMTKNFLINCKFTIDDVNNAIKIYGLLAPLIKGRMAATSQILQRAERM